MSKLRFTIHEKQVKEVLGSAYNLASFVEGVDFVRRKAFRGERIVFRSDFFEKEAKSSEKEVEEVGKQATSLEVVVDSGVQVGVSCVERCKITRKYPNTRFVETEKGRVFVGGKGINLKCGQVIRVKNFELFLGRE